MTNKVTFFRDTGNLFKCNVKIEGASLNESRARLVLLFENGTNLLFNGTINSDGVCEVTFPALKEVKSSTGDALLEIIADSTYFESWKSNFDVKTRKNVTVMSEVVVRPQRESRKVIVNVTPVETKTPKKKRIRERKKVNTTGFTSLFAESCSVEDMAKVKRFLTGYNSLNENKRHKLLTELKKFKPSQKLVEWSEDTFVDPDSSLAKYCMKRIESKH